MPEHLTIDQLQTGLSTLDSSPADNGTLEMIVCRPGIDERVVLEQAELDSVQGLIGDNWLARGSRHTPDGTAHPETQITLMNSRVIQLIAQDRSRWALAGDQLFVDLDLSADNLQAGQQLNIGSAVLEISPEPHNGCKKFAQRFGKDAVRLVVAKEGQHLRLRGVNARVILGGTIHAGDTVTKIE